MKMRTSYLIVVIALFALALSLPSRGMFNSALAQTSTATPVAEEEGDEVDEPSADGENGDDEVSDDEVVGEEIEPQLATASVSGEMVQFGRSVMTARENHWVWDSIPPINGPNEEVNPMDAFLGTLIACGMFIYEAVGVEEGIDVHSLSAQVEGALDARGVAGAPVNPRLRNLHVTMSVEGPTVEEAAMMAEQFSVRCPIYTTLARSAPITVVNVVDGEESDGIATEPLDVGVDVEDDADGEVELQLGRPTASGQMVQPGRALMWARGNYWVYDSVPPLNGPNEEMNPLDAFLGALPACAMYIYEAVGLEQDIPIDHLSAAVEGDLDPRGVAGMPVNPRLREFRVTVNVAGPTAEEAEMMAEAVRVRCPIFTTLVRAAPIEIANNVMGTQRAGVILQVGFTYDVEVDEYVAEVAPLAEDFASVEGLSWKIWTVNEDESRAGGIFLFEQGDALEAFLESELFEVVATHPALSEFTVEVFDVLEQESTLTRGPIR